MDQSAADVLATKISPQMPIYSGIAPQQLATPSPKFSKILRPVCQPAHLDKCGRGATDRQPGARTLVVVGRISLSVILAVPAKALRLLWAAGVKLERNGDRQRTA